MSRIIALLIALSVAIGLALWLISKDRVSVPTNQPLLNEFTVDLGNIERIEIANANEQLLLAQLVDGQWRANHLHSQLYFPMDYDSLVALIDSLRGAKKVEAKTQNPANFARLGLQDIAQPDSQARLVTLATPDQSFSLLVGNTANNGFGSFVRTPEDTQTWQLDKVIRLPDSHTSWLINPVKPLDPNNVFRVVRRGEETWQIVRDEPRESEDGVSNGRSGPFVLAGMRADEQLVFPNVLQNSIAAMLSVRFEDIAARDELAFDESGAEPIIIDFDTAQGALMVSLYQIEDRYFVTYDSAALPWVNDWAFVITEFNYRQFAKGRSDFVEPAEATDQEQSNERQRSIDEGDAPGS
ncbi:DUF4340 domain-containing protein [Alteromonas sp. ASW11-36]|uniref:DUF4340 domain-containing protein n=1 Tax=Alteromonas arenosi TaxID=3055817 RepID=A0ABT7SU52_9ALTE|nr:DUF4340 domain-containing protein [Alteromonas sp. ASW11-36]MDM7859720.1 DUF4340 domain-containing protein [Alteromonas sp. ASW11-36]